jgi:hypothetical protein
VTVFVMDDLLIDPAPVATVPEPSSYALLATGRAGVAAAGRRRRRV